MVTVRETSDETLLDRFLSGDETAFNELVRLYREAIFRYCLRMLRDPDEATDIAQEVFIKVYHKAAGFKKMSSFKTWLYKIATNMTYNRLRRRKLFSPLTSILGKGEEPRLLDELIAEQQRLMLQTALDKLPAKQKQIVLLRVYDELGFKDIALIMNSKESTVKSNFFFAVQNLRKNMEA